MDNLVSNHYYTALTLFLLAIAACNIPVGLLRLRFRKYSRPWARCIYAPILFNIALRRFIGFTLHVIPFTVLAVLAGQLIAVGLARAGKKAAMGAIGDAHD